MVDVVFPTMRSTATLPARGRERKRGEREGKEERERESLNRE